jgi:glycosyltransferase involved in cell wall biosynthesis
VLAVIAQLTPWKGQAEAVEMARLLRRERPRLRLLLVGSAKFTAPGTRFDNASYARRLAQRVDAEGLQETVRLLGEREDVPQIMAALDLLLLPSWREAFGRVAAEAMAVGVPVLATDVGGPAEIVRDGVDGLHVDVTDRAALAAALVSLLRDSDRRRAMGEAGRVRALECFTAERMAAESWSLAGAVARREAL